MPTVSAALRVLADGPRPQAPARPEQQDLEHDHDDDERHRDRALVEERLEEPADDREVDQPRRAARSASKVPAPVGELLARSVLR